MRNTGFWGNTLYIHPSRKQRNISNWAKYHFTIPRVVYSQEVYSFHSNWKNLLVGSKYIHLSPEVCCWFSSPLSDLNSNLSLESLTKGRKKPRASLCHPGMVSAVPVLGKILMGLHSFLQFGLGPGIDLTLLSSLFCLLQDTDAGKD